MAKKRAEEYYLMHKDIPLNIIKYLRPKACGTPAGFSTFY